MSRKTVQRLSVSVIALIVVVIATMQIDAQSKSSRTKPTGDAFNTFRHYVPNIVRIIEELGKGHVDETVELLVQEGREDAVKAASGPFETDIRETWKRELARFKEFKAGFENIELIGYKKLSSQSYNLLFVGNSRFGPMQLKFDIYSYRNRWFTNGYLFHTDWRIIEKTDGYTLFDQAIVYNLPTERVANTKKDSSDTE